jgi:hypothetical protein
MGYVDFPTLGMLGSGCKHGQCQGNKCNAFRVGFMKEIVEQTKKTKIRDLTSNGCISNEQPRKAPYRNEESESFVEASLGSTENVSAAKDVRQSSPMYGGHTSEITISETPLRCL